MHATGLVRNTKEKNMFLEKTGVCVDEMKFQYVNVGQMWHMWPVDKNNRFVH